MGYKEMNMKEQGIKVSGYSDGFFYEFKSPKKLQKEATENALKMAGPEYDVLTNVTVEMKMKLFYTRYVVNGNAHKSEDIISK
jgi:hypothetical protein